MGAKSKTAVFIYLSGVHVMYTFTNEFHISETQAVQQGNISDCITHTNTCTGLRGSRCKCSLILCTDCFLFVLFFSSADCFLGWSKLWKVGYIKTQSIKSTIKQECVTDMGWKAMHKMRIFKCGEKSILVR